MDSYEMNLCTTESNTVLFVVPDSGDNRGADMIYIQFPRAVWEASGQPRKISVRIDAMPDKA